MDRLIDPDKPELKCDFLNPLFFYNMLLKGME